MQVSQEALRSHLPASVLARTWSWKATSGAQALLDETLLLILCGFDLYFPKINDFEHLFHILAGHFDMSLEKCLLRSFAHLKILDIDRRFLDFF